MEIRKHPTGPVPKWGLYFYWGRGITRVVITAPFIRLTLMPVTQSLGNSYLFPKQVLSHGESSEEVPQFLWLFSQPFLLKEIQSSTLNLLPLLTRITGRLLPAPYYTSRCCLGVQRPGPITTVDVARPGEVCCTHNSFSRKEYIRP